MEDFAYLGGENPGDFWLKSVAAKLNGEPIEDGGKYSVDSAVQQAIQVKWNIGNKLSGAQIWSGCATAYDMTNGKKLTWGKSAADFQDGLGTENLKVGLITKPTHIRINVMATQRSYAFAREPDISLWKAKL